MGFWSALGKIGKLAGAGAATAFTGGAAAPLLFGAIGDTLSGMAGQSAQNRGAEADYGLQRDMVRLAAERDYRDSQNDAYRNAMRSAYAMNWKPVSTPGAHIKNVFEGQTLSPEARRAAEAMQRKAMIALLEGKPLDISTLKKAGLLEKIGGGLGMGMSTIGSLGSRGMVDPRSMVGMGTRGGIA